MKRYIFWLIILLPFIFAAAKPIAGYTLYNGVNPVVGADVIVFVNITLGAPFFSTHTCDTSLSTSVTGIDGGWAANLNNLKYTGSSTDCSTAWATGNPIWIQVDPTGATPVINNVTNTSFDTVSAGTGLQYLDNVTFSITASDYLNITLISPNADGIVNNETVFPFRINVSCTGDCGNVSVALDPRQPEKAWYTKVYEMFKQFWGGITAMAAGGDVPTVPSSPFWTDDVNPYNYTHNSCLGNMSDTSCIIEWNVTVNATLGATYEFFAYANGTVNAESEHINLTVQENVAPLVSLTVTPQEINQTQTSVLAATVTDDSAVNVTFRVTSPSASVTDYDDTSAPFSYNYDTIITTAVGNYTVQAIATDAYGNVNNTEYSWFTVTDVTPPTFSNNDSGSPTLFEDSVTVSIDVEDNMGISSVGVFTDLDGSPGSAKVYRTLTHVGGGTYRRTFNVESVGTYEWQATSTDVNSNSNLTQNYTHLVQKDDPSPYIELTLNGQEDNVVVEYEDSKIVHGNLSLGEGDLTLLRDGVIIDTVANVSETPTLVPGVYNYTLIFNNSGNYSDYNISYLMTVTKSTPTINLTLNGVASNANGEIPFTVLTHCNLITLNEPINLTVNGSYIGSGLTQNDTRVYASLGTYNATCTYDGNQNYTSATLTRYVSLGDTTNPQVNVSVNSPINQTQNATINASVTDNGAISSVVAQFSGTTTYADVPLSLIGGYWIGNLSTTLTDIPGTYTVTIVATDASANINNSETTTFMLQDVTPPHVVSNITNINDPLSASTITVDWQDNVAVDEVNITVYNGGYNNTQLFTSAPYTFTDNLAAGTYSWYSESNDSSDNYNTSSLGSFTVPKADGLAYTSLLLNGVPNNISIVYGAGHSVQVSGSVPDGTITLYEDGLSQGVGYQTINQNLSVGYYNYTYTLIGSVNYSDVTETLFVNVTPATPDLTLLLNSTDGDRSMPQGNVTLNCSSASNIVNNLSLYINGSLSFNSTSPLSYTSNMSIGVYNITCAYSGDLNYTSYNTSHTLTLLDASVPQVSALEITPIVNQTQNVSVNVTVTDDVAVDTVIATFDGPGSLLNITLSLSGGKYRGNRSTTLSTVPGTYTVRIIANDTSGAINNGTTGSTLVRDITPPYLTLANNVSVGNDWNISVNWSDNILVDTVLIEVNESSTLTNYSAVYNKNYSIQRVFSPGTQSWRSHVNDSSNNQNTSSWYTFLVPYRDPAPNITFYLNGSYQNLSVPYGTNYAVYVNSTLPDGTFNLTENLLSLAVNTSHNLTRSPFVGQYNYTYFYSGSTNYSVYNDTLHVNVTKVLPSIILELNNATANLSGRSPFSVNISCVSNGTNNLSLYINGSYVLNSTSPLTHTTSFTQENNNVTCTNPGDTNYLSRNTTLHVNTTESSLYVDLVSPLNAASVQEGSVLFRCDTGSNVSLSNMTFYNNFDGSWGASDNISLSGLTDIAQFSTTLTPGSYEWNCLVENNQSNTTFADTNYTLTVTATPSTGGSGGGGGGGGGSRSPTRTVVVEKEVEVIPEALMNFNVETLNQSYGYEGEYKIDCNVENAIDTVRLYYQGLEVAKGNSQLLKTLCLGSHEFSCTYGLANNPLIEESILVEVSSLGWAGCTQLEEPLPEVEEAVEETQPSDALAGQAIAFGGQGKNLMWAILLFTLALLILLVLTHKQRVRRIRLDPVNVVSFHHWVEHKTSDCSWDDVTNYDLEHVTEVYIARNGQLRSRYSWQLRCEDDLTEVDQQIFKVGRVRR